MRAPLAPSTVATILIASIASRALGGDRTGSEGLPIIALLVAEQGVEDGAPVAWWSRKPPGRPDRRAATPRVAEAVLAADWQAAGARLASVAERASLLANERIGTVGLTPAQARAVGRVTGAAIVVQGTAVARAEDESSGMLEQTAGMKPVRGQACIAVLTLTAHRTDTGEVLATAEGTARSAERNPAVCGLSATEKATREIATAFRQRVLAAWQGPLRATR